MPHGGERTPNKPAAVSGPGKLSRRTDGGPGERLEFGDYDSGQVGEAQRLAAMQAAAPQRGRQSGQGGPPPPGAAGTAPVQDPFGPTSRPNEPITAGLTPETKERVLPEDPAPLIRSLYHHYPNEDLRRLLEFAEQKLTQ